jgi:hypothetical protein
MKNAISSIDVLDVLLRGGRRKRRTDASTAFS